MGEPCRNFELISGQASTVSGAHVSEACRVLYTCCFHGYSDCQTSNRIGKVPVGAQHFVAIPSQHHQHDGSCLLLWCHQPVKTHLITVKGTPAPRNSFFLMRLLCISHGSQVWFQRDTSSLKQILLHEAVVQM